MEKNFLTSKTVWAGLVIAGVGIAQSLGLPVPYIEAILSIAGGLGLYGIRDAIDKNK